MTGHQLSGDPSHWDSDVFNAYDANIGIDGGALMTNRLATLEFGEADVSGQDSKWEVTELLNVGGGVGYVLNVSNAGQLTCRDTYVASEPGLIGTIAVSGTTGSSPSQFINDGDLFVGGNDAQAGGIGILDGQTHSRIEVGQSLTIWNDGVVNINARSTLIADSIDNTHGGEFNFSAAGTLQTNQFEGDLDQGGTLLPGGLEAGSTFVLGDLTQQNGAKLILDVGGTAAGVNHDLVNLSGVAFVDGQIGIRLINGFEPDPSGEFTVLAADNLLGFFINVFNGQRLDTVSGVGSFVVNYGIGSPYGEDRIVLSDYEPAGGLTVTPDSMTVVRGVHASGSAEDLFESDNTDVSIRRATSDIQSRTSFQVTSTSPIANPGRMVVTLEGSVFARSQVTQSIELYDYNSGSWEEVDSRTTTWLLKLLSRATPLGLSNLPRTRSKLESRIVQ